MNGVRMIAAAVALVCLAAGRAGAQPEPWQHPDGAIHYYDALAAPDGITWPAARALAQDSGGYLATLTSQVEDNFVFGLVDSDIYWYQRPGSGRWAGPWIGGFQPTGSPEPDSGWRWVTTEPFGFRNWSPGEPDNEGGNDNALHFGESDAARMPTWDDAGNSDDSIRGFVRELSADSTTIGLTLMDSSASNAYILFAPNSALYTDLVDNKGRLVHSWSSSYRPGLSCYLLEDGSLLRTAQVYAPAFPAGGAGGRVEAFDWDGSLTWSYDYVTALHCQHHDIEPMPNGNVLMIAWEIKTRAEAVAAGRDPALIQQGELWPDHVIEVDPATDSIVWEWHVWDHLVQDFDPAKDNYDVVAQHPELADVNFVPHSGLADWTHTNSVDYNPDLDQIMLSVHNFGEAWVIDHSTATAEARGHTGGRRGMGGDILYRWGNPQTYRAGDSTDQRFFGQHDARWIEPGLPGAGHIMVFNNGFGRPDSNYSTVDEFIPACDSAGAYLRPLPGVPFGPAAAVWTYRADPPSSFFSGNMSGAHRLPSGNTFICCSQDGALLEVTPDARVVWRYINPVETGPLYQGDRTSMVTQLFRGTRFEPDYPGLAGRDLTPGYPIERYRTPSSGIRESGRTRNPTASLWAGPNPFGRQTTVHFSLPHATPAELGIFSVDGRLIRALPATGSQVVWNGDDDAGRPVDHGVYYCRLRGPCFVVSQKLVKAD
jgi:hypothetical protein